MIKATNVFDFIETERSQYLKPIEMAEGWFWSMQEHLRKSFLYKNFQFYEDNENRDLRPNKNIVLAIRNLQNRTEGFDVKNIDIYVDDVKEYYKSFLTRKYHDKWAIDNKIDTFIDELVDSYGDYGGALVRDNSTNRPEVVDLLSLYFCNQHSILDNPFCIRHSFSQSQLREQEMWGKEGAEMDIETLISLVKKEDKDEIDIFEVVGTMPVEWLSGEDRRDTDKKDIQQIQVVAFYKKENDTKQGVTLFRKRLPKLPFKLLKRDDIKNRALGRGGIEELFEDQKWTSWNEIKITEMMEATSKMIVITNDKTLAAKHPTGMKDMENMEFLELQPGRDAKILDNYPRNLVVFDNAVARWQEHAQLIGAASEQLLGKDLNSGVPFKLYEAKNIEDKGMHTFRMGHIAVFMEEIYRDWSIPHISSEIANDHNFLSELSVDEIQEISDKVAAKEANRVVAEKILKGGIKKMSDVSDLQSAVELKKQVIKQEFISGGTKRFIEILKKDIAKGLAVKTNIAGKQKNLVLLTDKLVSVLRQFISTPQIRQDPEMVKLLNVILESSGMSPMMFGSSNQGAMGAMGAQGTPQSGTEPLKQLSESNAMAQLNTV